MEGTKAKSKKGKGGLRGGLSNRRSRSEPRTERKRSPRNPAVGGRGEKLPKGPLKRRGRAVYKRAPYWENRTDTISMKEALSLTKIG